MSVGSGGGGGRPEPELSQSTSWRNPTVFLSQQRAAAGGRSFLQELVRFGRPRGQQQQQCHAHDSDDLVVDDLVAHTAGLAAALAPPDPSHHHPDRAGWRLMVALAAVSVLICYADRSNISTAIIPMAGQFGWDASRQGLVLSAFFAGYLCTQLLGGALADRHGGQRVLAGGVAAWSITTCLTPQAAALGLPALLAMRVAMGLGEGVAFPAIHALIARGVPPERQSTAVAVVTAASYGGTALAFGLAPTIIEDLGWPWVFYLFGASAALWLPFWLPLRLPGADSSSCSSSGGSSGGSGGKAFSPADVWRDLFGSWGPPAAAAASPSGVQLLPPAPPDAAAGVSAGKHQAAGSSRAAGGAAAAAAAADEVPLVPAGPPQQQLQLQGQGQGLEDGVSEAGTDWSDGIAVAYRAHQSRLGTGFAALMQTREVWAICIAQYTGSWGFYGLLSWLPSFFKDQYHVELAQLASFTMIPYVVQGGVGAASGVLADKLIARGWPIKRVRRSLQTVGMLGPAACMVVAASPLTDGSPAAASAWITLGLGLNALTLAGVSVSQLDVAPRHAGVVFAAGNTSATAAGLLAVPVTGLMLDITHSWALVFAVAALHYVIGAAAFYAWVGDRPVPEDG